jgi:hypothetical protein
MQSTNGVVAGAYTFFIENNFSSIFINYDGRKS